MSNLISVVSAFVMTWLVKDCFARTAGLPEKCHLYMNKLQGVGTLFLLTITKSNVDRF